MFGFMLRHHSNGAGADFRREFVRRLACHGPYFSRVGVSGKSGAVHTKAAHRTIGALYATIFEQTDAAIYLLDNGRFTGAMLLQRPAAEALVDLIALTKDDGYLEFMVAAFDEQWLRLMTNGMKGNPILTAFWGDPDVQKEHAAVARELAEFKKRDIRELSVRDRFEKAGMLNEYGSVYNSLCCETHNNIRALYDRHIDEDGAGTAHVAVNKTPDETRMAWLVDLMLGIIINSSGIVHAYFDSAAVETFKVLDAKRAELLKKA